jgi:hypothetical protein
LFARLDVRAADKSLAGQHFGDGRLDIPFHGGKMGV